MRFACILVKLQNLQSSLQCRFPLARSEWPTCCEQVARAASHFCRRHAKAPKVTQQQQQILSACRLEPSIDLYITISIPIIRIIHPTSKHSYEIMDITQRDRDALRRAQHKLHSSEPFNVGNIVEHKIQDPATYKTKSRQEQGLSDDVIPSLPKIEYKSLYLDNGGVARPYQTSVGQTGTNQGVETSEIKAQMPIIAEEDKTLMNLPITPDDIQANMWLNMDRVEFEKLEWMSDKADQEFKRRFKSSIHFDSEGKAVSTTMDADKQHTQAHDINSLMNLLDSTYQPQVTFALSVITKIASRATIGQYDAVFDENILQILLRESLLRVRHHMDSSNETICQAALRCLRSLLCNTQIDEIFLDKLSPLKSGESDITMWLSSVDGEFDIGMRDNDCVLSDAILSLIVRTDLLTRFKYLLNTKKETKYKTTYHDCIIDVLIRIARHSQEICWILNNEELPKMIIDLFLPADIARHDKSQQSLALRSLKFLRIISSAAYELNHRATKSDEPIIKFPTSIVPIISAYYYTDCFLNNTCDVMVRIQIETLRLMDSLFMLNEFSGHVFSTMTLEQSSLVQHVRSLTQLDVLKPIESPSSLDWQYAASLMKLIGHMMTYERRNTAKIIVSQLWANFIRQMTFRWFNDIIRARAIPHQDISIALKVAANVFLDSNDESSILDFYTLLLQINEVKITERKHEFESSKPVTKSNRLLPKSSVQEERTNMSASYFRFLVRQAIEESQLGQFLKLNGRQRDPIMLKSYGFMNFNTSKLYSYKINSVIGINTPFILLSLYLTLLQKSGTKFEHVLANYFDDENLLRYMRIASCYHKQLPNYEADAQQSILCQIEVRILANTFLLLAKYYLQLRSCYSTDPTEMIDELGDVDLTQGECYSQFILHVISIIGLINPEVDSMLTIKDELLTKVVLNECLQKLIVIESLDSKDKTLTKMRFNHLKGHWFNGELSEHHLLVETDLISLKAIYLSCEQPGRFWIFQPLMEYYSCQIQGSEETKRVKDGKWFLKNVGKNLFGKIDSTECGDLDTITRILKMNASLMHRSPSYLKVVVKENIEEYLCMIGSIFLDDDLFLDEKMSQVIWHNLEIILSAGLMLGVDKLFVDASRKISCLNIPLIDFFNKLVDQYEAASYNDISFTNYLLLFLCPKSDKTFRKKLFSDKLETCLSQVRISRSDVWIPEDFIFKNRERDPEIKSLIRRSRPYITRSTFLDFYVRFHSS